MLRELSSETETDLDNEVVDIVAKALGVTEDDEEAAVTS